MITLTKDNAVDVFKFVIPTLGNDVYRRNLMYLSVKVTDNTVRLLSANGFSLKFVTFELVNEFETEDCEFLIAGSDLKKFFTMVKSEKEKTYGMDLLVKLSPEKLTVGNVQLNHEQPQYEEYPNLERIISGETVGKINGKLYTGVNPEQVALCMKGVPKDQHFKMTASSEGDPIKFETNQQDNGLTYHALIMPIIIK